MTLLDHCTDDLGELFYLIYIFCNFRVGSPNMFFVIFPTSHICLPLS